MQYEKRSFAADLRTCPQCLKGTLTIIAFITKPDIVHKILQHLGLPSNLPEPSPARRPSQLDLDLDLDLDPEDATFDETEPLDSGKIRPGTSREPP